MVQVIDLASEDFTIKYPQYYMLVEEIFNLIRKRTKEDVIPEEHIIINSEELKEIVDNILNTLKSKNQRHVEFFRDLYGLTDVIIKESREILEKHGYNRNSKLNIVNSIKERMFSLCVGNGDNIRYLKNRLISKEQLEKIFEVVEKWGELA